MDPADSLNDDDLGWGSYSRQWRSQFAVFLLDKPIAITPGSRIRIELKQDKHNVRRCRTGNQPQPILGFVQRRLDSTSAIREIHLRESRFSATEATCQEDTQRFGARDGRVAGA